MLSRQNQAWHVAGALLYHRLTPTVLALERPLWTARARHPAERGPCLSFVKCCCNLAVELLSLSLQRSPSTAAPDPARQAAMAFPHLQQPSFLLVSVRCPPRAHRTGVL